MTDGKIVLFRWHHEPKIRETRILHGLSHCLLIRYGAEHTEADALLLTSELLTLLCAYT